MRIAIVTDSNSGITQNQAKEMGVYVLPMPFTINDTVFYEDINLTQDEFYDRLETGSEILTSQPSPEAVLSLWDQLLTEFDQIVHIPMSSGLSSSWQTASVLSRDYEGKVFVADNHRISVTQRQSVLDAGKMAEQGLDGESIRQKLEETGFESSIYIMVDTLTYLKKGGRITPAAAALGTLLKLKPVLQIQGEKLDAFAKARTVKQAKSLMISALKRDVAERFGDSEGNTCHLQLAYTKDREAALEFLEEMRAAFPGVPIHMDPLSLNVACHIGPGALALACTKKLEC